MQNEIFQPEAASTTRGAFDAATSQELRNSFKLFTLARKVGPVRPLEEEIDLKELAKRLSRTFPNLVTISDTANVLTVMGRVTVTPEGIAEGSGPVAERVKAILEEYVRDQSRKQTPSGTSPHGAERVPNPFRCQHCGLRLTRGRVYRRSIGGSVMLFCCKQCADHEEAETVKPGAKSRN